MPYEEALTRRVKAAAAIKQLNITKGAKKFLLEHSRIKTHRRYSMPAHKLQCAVRLCKNVYDPKNPIKFFRFPQTPERILHWIMLTDRLDIIHNWDYNKLSQTYHVCEKHFPDHALYETGQKAVRLQQVGPTPMSNCGCWKRISTVRWQEEDTVGCGQCRDSAMHYGKKRGDKIIQTYLDSHPEVIPPDVRKPWTDAATSPPKTKLPPREPPPARDLSEGNVTLCNVAYECRPTGKRRTRDFRILTDSNVFWWSSGRVPHQGKPLPDNASSALDEKLFRLLANTENKTKILARMETAEKEKLLRRIETKERKGTFQYTEEVVERVECLADADALTHKETSDEEARGPDNGWSEPDVDTSSDTGSEDHYDSCAGYNGVEPYATPVMSPDMRDCNISQGSLYTPIVVTQREHDYAIRWRDRRLDVNEEPNSAAPFVQSVVRSTDLLSLVTTNLPNVRLVIGTPKLRKEEPIVGKMHFTSESTALRGFSRVQPLLSSNLAVKNFDFRQCSVNYWRYKSSKGFSETLVECKAPDCAKTTDKRGRMSDAAILATPEDLVHTLLRRQNKYEAKMQKMASERKSMEPMKRKCQRAVLELKKVKAEAKALRKELDRLRGVERLFTPDQITALEDDSSVQGQRWSDDTIVMAHMLRLRCSSAGYKYLLHGLGWPLPGFNRLKRRAMELHLPLPLGPTSADCLKDDEQHKQYPKNAPVDTLEASAASRTLQDLGFSEATDCAVGDGSKKRRKRRTKVEMELARANIQEGAKKKRSSELNEIKGKTQDQEEYEKTDVNLYRTDDVVVLQDQVIEESVGADDGWWRGNPTRNQGFQDLSEDILQLINSFPGFSPVQTPQSEIIHYMDR